MDTYVCFCIRFIKTINKPYVTPYTSTLFEEKDDVKVGTNTRYDEELGDVCFSRLMGTYLENDKFVYTQYRYSTLI